MKFGIQEIDHVVCFVDDAKRAGDLLADIGFTVTPLSVMRGVGVANRLVLLKPPSAGTANFIELMSIVDESKLPESLKPHLVGGRGYRWMVLSGPDAAVTFEQLHRQGYPFAPPIPVERDWALPSGELLHLAFNVMMPIEAPIPFNFCAYRTLQHYLRPEFLSHANGAQTLSAIFCQSEQPAECLGYFEALFGCSRRPLGGGLYAVTPNRIDLIVGTPAEWQQLSRRKAATSPQSSHTLVGCGIRVDDLAETEGHLLRRGLVPSRTPLGLLVDSPLHDHTVLIFHS